MVGKLKLLTTKQIIRKKKKKNLAEAELKVESERVRVEKEYLGCSRRPSETVRESETAEQRQ